MIFIEKYNPEKVFSTVYEDTKTKSFYVKRFIIEVTERKMDFIGEEEKNRLVLLTGDKFPRIEVAFDMKMKTKGAEKEEITVHEFIGVKGFKAKGKRISLHAVKKIEFLEPLQIEEPVTDIPIEDGVLSIEDAELMSEDGSLKSEDGERKMKNEEGKVKKEKGKVKSEKIIVKSEDKEVKDEKGRGKIEDEKEVKKERVKVKIEKGSKENNKEEKKKNEDPGDAVQMELPL
jgi:hypothetical protein